MDQQVTKGLFGAAASIVNNTVNNLFQSGVIKAQKDAVKINSYLSILSQEEQNNLAVSLQNAQTDTDRMAILTNAVTSIQIAQAQNTSNTNMKMALIFVGAGFVVIIAAFFIKKSLDS